jgi:hypothetical protein
MPSLSTSHEPTEASPLLRDNDSEHINSGNIENGQVEGDDTLVAVYTTKKLNLLLGAVGIGVCSIIENLTIGSTLYSQNFTGLSSSCRSTPNSCNVRSDWKRTQCSEQHQLDCYCVRQLIFHIKLSRAETNTPSDTS